MMLPDRQPDSFEIDLQNAMAEPVKTPVDAEVPPTVAPTLVEETPEITTPREAVVPTMHRSPPPPKSLVKPSSSLPKKGSPPSLPEPDLPETVDADDSLSHAPGQSSRAGEGYWKLLVQSGDVLM